VAAQPTVARPAPLSPPLAVKMAETPGSSNAGVYIALARGYFRDEGLDVTLETFDSGERAIPALATNQVDVAGIGVSAGLFNALARSLPIKIVGGLSYNEPGYSSTGFLVRKDLIDSGRVRDYPDLRGLKISLTGQTSASRAEFSRALEFGGLTEADVETVFVPSGDVPLALSGGAIDAGFTNEPFIARAVQLGAAVRWKGADDIYPGHQLTVLLAGPDFVQQHPEAVTRWLAAYVRGAREYATIIKGGGDRPWLYQVLTEYTPIKDVNVYAAVTPSGIHPDAGLNIASLESDQELWAAQGFVPQRADLAAAIDLQYLDAAVARLGPQR
jgi:NitT/TauT family transport system substrate-binding protein